jgi:hypothetical protein
MPDQKMAVRTEPYDSLTEAVDQLLNRFPVLGEGERIRFSSLEDTSVGETAGLAWFPLEGEAVESVKGSVGGRTVSDCRYPVKAVMRISPEETKRRDAKKFLDALGEWVFSLPKEDYPELAGKKRLTGIVPQSWGFREKPEGGGWEDWAITLSFRYTWEQE